MAKRKTKEYYHEQFIKKGIEKYGNQFSYEKTNYVNTRTKVIITCKDHGDVELLPNNFLHRYPCSKCSDKIDQERRLQEFIDKANKKYDSYYDYSRVSEDFIDNDSRVKIICPEHGLFEVRAVYHNSDNGTSGCKKCSFRFNGETPTKSRYTPQQYSKIITEETPYTLVESTFKGVRSEATFICDLHGEFNKEPLKVRRGAYCPDCLKEKRKEWMSRSFEQFLEDAIEKYGDKYIYEKERYIDYNTPMSIYCKDHGEFERSPNAVLSLYYGCPECGKRVLLSKTTINKEKFIEKASPKLDNFEIVEYNGYTNKALFRCKKHDYIFPQKPVHFLSSKYRCPKCITDATSGENASNYKGGISKENDNARRIPEYQRWKRLVKEKFECCDKCGKPLSSSEEKEAHHLYSYKSYPELKHEVSNGVVLCRPCHNAFHMEYGFGDNTKEQYEEYKKQ